MISRPRVLVVEDDIAIAQQLVGGLHRAGFHVSLHTQGDGAAERVLAGQFDSVVLDLMLPGLHGLDVLASLRGRSSVPVIVLTAGVDLDTRIRSFTTGAADYLPKPFFLAELVARLRARLATPGEFAQRRAVRWGRTTVDLDARVARVDDEEIPLTAAEFNVLALLIERHGRAVTRAMICETALSLDGEVEERTVDSHVARIRRKLGRDGAALRTIWGVGYRLDVAGDSSP